MTAPGATDRAARTARSVASGSFRSTATCRARARPARSTRSDARDVAVRHGQAAPARLAHALGVEIEGDDRHPGLLEHAHEELAADAVAEHDHVTRDRRRRPFLGGAADGGGAPRRDARAAIPGPKRRAKGVTSMVRTLAAKKRPISRGLEEPGVGADGGQDERELADLGEHQAGEQRHPQGQAQDEPGQRREQGLADEDRGDEGEDERGLGEEHAGVEQHAHRHEEEAREDVAERERVGERLVAVLGARRGRPRRGRRPGRATSPARDGEPRDPRRHQHDGEDEEVAPPRGRHQAQGARDDEAGQGQGHDAPPPPR